MTARANIAGAAQSHRLETGGVIDRSKPISFRFDGKSYGGFEGDTLASALIANGVRLVARSFKYHRPRGILSAGAEELRRTPVLRISELHHHIIHRQTRRRG
jgi:sarcosine oxidase subunit alpha